MIRVGVLGYASIARRSLVPAFLAHSAFELAAIGTRTPARTDLPVRACSYDELVSSDDIDFIYCALPTGLHYEWVAKALAAHKHVLCEKSLVCRLAEARALAEAARAADVLLMESFQFRFHAQNLFVKELLARGAIGELRQLVVRFGVPPFPEGASNIRYSAELGGGALLDNGAYTLKCATYLLGPDVRVLAAMEGGAKPEFGDVPVTGSIMMSANFKPQISVLRSRISDAQTQTPGIQLPTLNPQPVCIQTAYGFDHFYQNGYELWGTKGKISTSRAFTARSDFAAPVVVETASGREERRFADDHFARMLDFVSGKIAARDFAGEYAECLRQAELVEAVRRTLA